MKTLFAIAFAAFALSGCAVYHGHHDNYPGAKKEHPHGCPPGQAKKGRC
ncbi:hypothetical protein [Ottowia caeni]|nr:hypothetical protein [Ottowia caeni]